MLVAFFNPQVLPISFHALQEKLEGESTSVNLSVNAVVAFFYT
jgi:hypothetical protein